MKRMTDIKEEILLSYFPDFLDTKMLKYVELKFKLEDELEKITGWNKIKKKAPTRQTQKMMEAKFESIDKDSSIAKFWNNNSNARKMYAKELKENVNNLIRQTISSQIVKTKKPVMIMRGNKYTGEVEWVDCDKCGNDLKVETGPEKNSFGNWQENVNQQNETLNSDSYGHGINLQAKNSGNEQEIVIQLLNAIRDLTDKEAQRIFDLYYNKILTVQTALNYYQICLVLFGNKAGAKEVGRFIKTKLVSIVIEDYVNLFRKITIR